MRYDGVPCPDCGVVFDENDDVVVCPECGTPVHRSCWQSRGGCVNEEKHGDDFAWINPKPQQVEETVKKDEKPPIVCPVCGRENPSGTPTCRVCGQKFTLFGVNLLDKQNELNAQDEEQHGDKFKNNSNNAQNENASVESENGSQQNEYYGGGFSENGDGSMPFQPFSAQNGQNGSEFNQPEFIDGVRCDDISEFVRVKQLSYISKFKRLLGKKKLSWNWAAFIFGPYWYFYRKMIKPGIVYMTIAFCQSLVFMTPINAFLNEYYNLFSESPTIEDITDAVMNQASLLFQKYAVYLILYFVIALIIRVVGAVFADVIYKRHAFSCISRAHEKPSEREFHFELMRSGGATFVFPILAYGATYLLSYLVDFIVSR